MTKHVVGKGRIETDDDRIGVIVNDFEAGEAEILAKTRRAQDEKIMHIGQMGRNKVRGGLSGRLDGYWIGVDADLV